MASTGIGVGIGEGLGELGDALRRRRDTKNTDREKQADAYHTKGVKLATDLLNLGYSTKHDPNAGAVLIDVKTGQPATDPPPQVGQLFSQFLDTSKQAQALYGPHETGALVQHFRKFLGKQPKAPVPDPRAANFSPESLQSEAVGKPNTILQEMADMKGAGLTAEQIMTSIQNKYKTQPDTPPTPKPLTFQYHPQTGGLTSITDPNSGTVYDASNIAQAAPETKARWEAIQSQQVAEQKRKDDAAAAKEKEAETKASTAEASRVKAAELAETNRREDQRRAFEHSDASAAERERNSKDQKDYSLTLGEAKADDAKYKDALRVSNFADEAMKEKSAAKDKLLAGQLTKVSEGRFNTSQYDNLVKKAGLANTFQQWMESANTGQLTDEIRSQLVGAAHSLRDAADKARTQPKSKGAGTAANPIVVSPEDLK